MGYFRSAANCDTVRILSRVCIAITLRATYQLKRDMDTSGLFLHKFNLIACVLLLTRRLQNAIKYWTKVMRKTAPAGQRVKIILPLFNPDNQMLHGHPGRYGLQPHRI